MELKYINHDFSDSFEQTDWKSLKEDLRDYLRSIVRHIIENFEENCRNKVSSDGNLSKDPTMFAGSGGIAFCLFKYWQLIKYEVKQY
jgi:hypothetical protein